MSGEKKKQHEYSWTRPARSESPTPFSPLRTSIPNSDGEDEGEEELEGGEILSHWSREGSRGSADVGIDVRRRPQIHSVFSVDDDDDGDDESHDIARGRSRSRTPTQEDAPALAHWSRERVRTPPIEGNTSSSWGRIRTPPRDESLLAHRGRERSRSRTPVRHLCLDQIKPEPTEPTSHIARSSASGTRSRSPSLDGYDMSRLRTIFADDQATDSMRRRGSVDSSSVRRSAEANPLLRSESDNARWQSQRSCSFLSRESSLTALFSSPPNSSPIAATIKANRYDNVPTLQTLSSSDLAVLNEYKYTIDSASESGSDEQLDDLDTPDSLSSFGYKFDTQKNIKLADPVRLISHKDKYSNSSPNLMLNIAELTNDKYDTIDNDEHRSRSYRSNYEELKKPSPRTTLDKYIMTTTNNSEAKDNPPPIISNMVKSLSAKEINYFKAHHSAPTLLSPLATNTNDTNKTSTTISNNEKTNVTTNVTTINLPTLSTPYSLPIAKSSKNLAINTRTEPPIPATTIDDVAPQQQSNSLEPLAEIGNEETKSVCVVWEHQDAGVWLDFLQDVSSQNLSGIESMQGKLKVLSDEINTFRESSPPPILQPIHLTPGNIPSTSNSHFARLAAFLVTAIAVFIVYLFSSSEDLYLYTHVISPA